MKHLIPFIDGGVFEPDVVQAMGQAYDAICAELDRRGEDLICSRYLSPANNWVSCKLATRESNPVASGLISGHPAMGLKSANDPGCVKTRRLI